MIPLQVSFECLIVSDVWDPTARLLHGINGGLVKRPRLLQPELLLELLQSLRSGHDCLQSALLENIYVAITLQVLLEANIYIERYSFRMIQLHLYYFQSTGLKVDIHNHKNHELKIYILTSAS